MSTKPCPICRNTAVKKFLPFCSLRCQRIDLGRWFSESYRVPTDDVPDSAPESWVGGNEGTDEALEN